MRVKSLPKRIIYFIDGHLESSMLCGSFPSHPGSAPILQRSGMRNAEKYEPRSYERSYEPIIAAPPALSLPILSSTEGVRAWTEPSQR